MPSTVTSIGEYAFYFSTVETVAFAPGSRLTKIGKWAFASAKSLLRLVRTTVRDDNDILHAANLGDLSLGFVSKAPSL